MLLWFFVAIALLVFTFTALFFRLASRVDASVNPVDWLDDFSMEFYAPMRRLLNRGDFAFLESQAGYRPEIGKRLLSQRKAIFASYMSMLIRDYNQLLSIAKWMLVNAPEDRPEFARALWRQQLAFYYTVCVIRVRLALYPIGQGNLDCDRLVSATVGLWQQVQEPLLQSA